jgi:hypothetical protein
MATVIPILHINQEGTAESLPGFFAAAHRSEGDSVETITPKHVVIMCSTIFLNPKTMYSFIVKKQIQSLWEFPAFGIGKAYNPLRDRTAEVLAPIF